MKSYIPGAIRLAREHAESKEVAELVRDILNDEQAASVPSIFMPWDAAAAYAAGDRVRYNALLYKCLQAHTAQAGWKPDAAPSLWTRIDDPAVQWPAWVQPSSTNPYGMGAKVTHKGKKWISTNGSNVWEPGVYGWEEAA